MNSLTRDNLLELHHDLIVRSGGSHGVRDLGLLESALAQPMMAVFGTDLYPTLVEKAAALGHSLIQNHPFIDGNKRIGHAAMAMMLDLNTFKINASVDEQESIVLAVASGSLDRKSLTHWLESHVTPLS